MPRPKNKRNQFGTCCEELNKSMTIPPQRFFFVSEESDRLVLTVGAVETEEGTGWFDSVVFFCPFCGTQLQTREEIKEKWERTYGAEQPKVDRGLRRLIRRFFIFIDRSSTYNGSAV
jgi:hypothetical protein